MKRDHLTLTAGFLPGLSLLIILICRRSLQTGQDVSGLTGALPLEWLWVMVEAAIFLLPLVILGGFRKYKKENVFGPGFDKMPIRAIPMLMTMAVAMALVNLLLGDLITGLVGKVYSDSHVFSPLLAERPSLWAVLLAVVVIPSIGGQLLFGDSLFRAYVPCGAVPALCVCALTYSLLTGTPETLVGTFLSMLMFLYVAQALHSMWAGIFAHGMYSVMHLLLLYVAGAYSGQELWSIVRLVMLFLLGLFLYLSMHSMEQLIEKGMLRRLEHIRKETVVSSILFSPGLWMTIFLFVISWIA